MSTWDRSEDRLRELAEASEARRKRRLAQLELIEDHIQFAMKIDAEAPSGHTSTLIAIAIALQMLVEKE